ncbi:MAG: hypothetical protein O2840_04895 [bacterium]|nr:hypothetical protein [bacterium]
MVSDISLTTFQNLYRAEYGVELSPRELLESATSLVNLYRAVYVKDTRKISQNYETKLQPTQN